MKGAILSPELVTRLLTLARQGVAGEAYDEDAGEFFCPGDHFGGNFDDAYYGGHSDGETELARELLTALRLHW